MIRRRAVDLVSAVLAVAFFAVFAGGCPPTPPPAPAPARAVWSPGVIYPAEHDASAANARGFVDVRGLVHAHSYYSHDACDGVPVDDNGVRDAVCLEDFRRGLCQSQHDFVFLTDHGDSFDEQVFPDVLLFQPERGDVLVGVGGGTANRVTCDDGHAVLIMAGSENVLMPVGLEHHADKAQYGQLTEQNADSLRDAGAVVLLAHPEDYDLDALLALPLDGFEMYNVHRNTVLGAGFALDLLLRASDGDPGVPHPDLLVLAIWSEDPDYLTRWGKVLATGKRVVSTMGTDCHRNTFKTILADGERADSYRRMMIAFSNHLLVKPGDDGLVDDQELKEALRKGRAFGVFEMLGYPEGFSATAEKDGVVYDLGDDVPVGATIRATLPAVRDLDPQREPPRLTLRVLRADADAAEGFVEVAAADGDIDVVADVAGAWRVEVRMLPLHLRQDLGDDDLRILDEKADADSDYVWIYANPLYVH